MSLHDGNRFDVVNEGAVRAPVGTLVNDYGVPLIVFITAVDDAWGGERGEAVLILPGHSYVLTLDSGARASVTVSAPNP